MICATPRGILKVIYYFVEVKQHTQHQSMAEEIQHLQLLERCRKRAAAEPTESLRPIFDTETQSTGNAAGASVAFADRKFYV